MISGHVKRSAYTDQGCNDPYRETPKSQEYHEHVDNKKLMHHVYRQLRDNYPLKDMPKGHVDGRIAESYKEFGALNTRTVTVRGTEQNYKLLFHHYYPNTHKQLWEIMADEAREKYVHSDAWNPPWFSSLTWHDASQADLCFFASLLRTGGMTLPITRRLSDTLFGA